jgi:hypothetical protein
MIEYAIIFFAGIFARELFRFLIGEIRHEGPQPDTREHVSRVQWHESEN